MSAVVAIAVAAALLSSTENDLATQAESTDSSLVSEEEQESEAEDEGGNQTFTLFVLPTESQTE